MKFEEYHEINIKCEDMITVDSVSFYDRKVVFQLPKDSEVE